MMAPSMLGMAVGSMVGRLASRAFGTARPADPPPAGDDRARRRSNIDAFATDWEIPGDEMRLWVHRPRARRPRAAVVAAPERGPVDPGAPARRRLPAGPERRRRPARLDRQRVRRSDGRAAAGAGRPRDPARRRDLARAAWRCGPASTRSSRSSSATPTGSSTPSPCGWSAATRCASPRPCAAGGWRRPPATTSSSNCSGSASATSRSPAGKAFVQGVVDRAGERGLDPLLSRAEAVPTPSELDAPGLWLARLET